MEIVAGTRITLAHDMLDRMARFRYRVFVQLLGWSLPCRDRIELDRFDREDTRYLLARQGEDVVGMARLLPTQRPYLLGDVFPQLMGSLPAPRDAAVWELSHFTAVGGGPAALGVDLGRRARRPARRAAPPVVVDGHSLFACWIEVPQPLRH